MQPEEGRHVLQYAARAPLPRPQRSPAHRHAVADPALRACAEDTGKCKMFYPERCASNAFVKKCRASCHAQYPHMEFCKPSLEAKFAELEERLNNLAALTSCKDGKDGEKGADGAAGPAGPPGPAGPAGEGGSPVVLTTTGTEEFPRTAGGDVDFKVNTPCKVGEMRSYPMKEQKKGTVDETTTVYYLYVCVRENLWSSIHGQQRFRMANGEEACEGHGYTKEQCHNLGCCCYGPCCEDPYGQSCADAGISTADDDMCQEAVHRPKAWPCENYRGE